MHRTAVELAAKASSSTLSIAGLRLFPDPCVENQPAAPKDLRSYVAILISSQRGELLGQSRPSEANPIDAPDPD